MTKQIKLIVFSIIGLIICCYLVHNNKIEFSHISGFYTEEFYLEINAPTGDIYYTLDGSEPDRSSFLYTEPINIVDASYNDNVYSARTDLSTAFLEEIDSDAYANVYTVPDFLVDKATIVRAVYYDIFGTKSEIITGTYFVDFETKTGYEDYNTISIVTNPDNLFGYDEGIYVLGAYYDEYSENPYGDWRDNYWHWWDANYRQTGMEWEREAIISVYNESGEFILDKDIGIRIQGGGSRGYYPKSLNIYARVEYDLTEQIEVDFWDTGYIADAITLSISGDDYYSKIKDKLTAQLCENLELVTMNYEPYNMFLNGEYWGFYYITEKYTDDFFAYYYDVNPNEVIFVKGGELEIGEDTDMESFVELQLFIETADLTNSDNINYLWSQLDKESTIDYFATMLFLGRTNDWYPMGSNSALWKTRSEGDGEYEDGKWRWVIYDMNSGAMNESLNDVDPIENTMNRSLIFANLCTNTEFVELLSKKIIEIGENEFSEDNVNDLIDEHIIEVEAAMENHFMRFYGEDLEVFYNWIENIRNFFAGRSDNMEQFIEVNFGEIYMD